MRAGRRHVLLIASQNESMGHLDQLDEAAVALSEVLSDSEIGACAPGLRNGELVLRGEQKAEKIRATIREAIAYAGEKRATLVLALLGHGFSPDNDPTLYYMGCDSRNGDSFSGVNVRELLGIAADHPGVRSVIAVIDTCTAAAAIPPNIAGGTQNGKIGLSLLMAAPVGKSAYDLGMSRELVRVLRAGVPGAGPELRLGVIGPQIQAALDAQDLRGFSYPGDLHAEPMWLAFNQRADRMLEAGSLGETELAAALRPVKGDRRLPTSLRELRELHDELSTELQQRKISPESDWAVVDLTRAVRVTATVIAAHKTVRLLREHLRDALDDISLRRALVVACRTVEAARVQAPLSVTRAVSLAALSYPSHAEPDSRWQLARFVVALADGAGIDPERPQLKDEWEASVGSIEAYNDALRERVEHTAARRFQLIVSYDALAGEWPTSVRAWVLYAGRECGKNDEIRCSADQAGAEEALLAAVSWAEREAASLGEDLDRVEVALPARRLLDWHPERVEHNGAWLGVQYRVLLRWSKRLEQTARMQGYNGNVRKRLEQLPKQQKADRLHWLGQSEVGDPQMLREELAMGRYSPASGLMDRPELDDGSLVELLLKYLPIVLWPQYASLRPAHCRRVATRWDWLPDDFLTAYRVRWAAKGEKTPNLIADIRAIWDDEDWLRFCGTADA